MQTFILQFVPQKIVFYLVLSFYQRFKLHANIALNDYSPPRGSANRSNNFNLEQSSIVIPRTNMFYIFLNLRIKTVIFLYTSRNPVFMSLPTGTVYQTDFMVFTCQDMNISNNIIFIFSKSKKKKENATRSNLRRKSQRCLLYN